MGGTYICISSPQISCMSTVENNWFRCVSSRDSDPEVIKGLLRIFKNQIHMLLETILNLVDGNVSVESCAAEPMASE